MARLRDALLEEVADSAADQAELDAILCTSPRESAASTPTGSVNGDLPPSLGLEQQPEEGEPPEEEEAAVPEALLELDAREIFSELDADRSGYLDRKEIAVLCQRMGRSQSEEAISHALSVMDTSHDGKVDWEEFSVWWAWTAQHEEEAALGHRPSDYPNHAFWAKQSPRPEGGDDGALTAQEQRALQLIEEEELIADGETGPPGDGVLTVEIVRCHGLLPADKNGKSDPYVKLELAGQRKSTKPKNKTLEPVYNESFCFDVQTQQTQKGTKAKSKSSSTLSAVGDGGDGSSTLQLEIWDKDRGAKDDFLGEVAISLQEVFVGKWSSATVGPLSFELQDPKFRVDQTISKLVGSRKADGSGEWQEHGKVLLKFSFEANTAAAKGGKKKKS
jgi:hypothetical protein